jgi:hypothetical protein
MAEGLTVRPCAYCGDPFKPKRAAQRFCSPPARCRWLAWEREHPRRKPPKRKRIETRKREDVTVRLRGVWKICEEYRLRYGLRTVADAAREMIVKMVERPEEPR